MKKSFKKFIEVLVIVAIICSIFIVEEKIFKPKNKDELINISDLSETFMENYFEELSIIEDNNKEKMLIVTSLNEISDNYEAINVIKAPNNQYILQSESEDAKNKALDKFKIDDTIIGVDENEMVKIYASELIEKDNMYSLAAIESDEEWTAVKEVMKDIAKSEE